MNLAQLSYFAHLAKVQHYTKAARELNITQPALSHSISSLESELGCQLFRKEGRNVRLTEDGHAFQGYVERGLAEIEQGVSEIKRRQGMVSGIVEVGAIGTVRSLYLPSAMKAYRDENGPLVEFRITQGETASLRDKLERGTCDLVITGPIDRPGVACTTLFHQRLVVAVNRDHPLASLDRVRYDNLIGHAVITYRRGITCGEVLEAFLEETNAPLDRLTLVRNYEDEVILGGLAVHESAVALTMLTSNLLPDPSLVVLPLDVEGSQDFYPVSLSYRSRVPHSPAVTSFINFLSRFEAPPYVRNDFPVNA